MIDVTDLEQIQSDKNLCQIISLGWSVRCDKSGRDKILVAHNDGRSISSYGTSWAEAARHLIGGFRELFAMQQEWQDAANKT